MCDYFKCVRGADVMRFTRAETAREGDVTLTVGKCIHKNHLPAPDGISGILIAF